MAISHVWSDGTGAGAWPDGEDNECLYAFSGGSQDNLNARESGGILFVFPKERQHETGLFGISQAIMRMPESLWPMTASSDPGSGTREWHALPFSCRPGSVEAGPPWSGKVAQGEGHLIKDLDEEILAKDDEPDGPRKEASGIIKNLRKRIMVLDDLLIVLGPRHTSWPKDMAIISGLLVGVTPTELQQDIYKSILRGIGWLSPKHLFHNAATMSKVSWCPTNLLNMPIANSNCSLRIAKDWDLIGPWKVIPVNKHLEKKCVWSGTHALMKARAQRALTHPDKCVLLAEPGVELVDKALLVEVMKKRGITKLLCCKYVGALRFHPAMRKEDIKEYIGKGEGPIKGEEPIEMGVR
jgi:hypothetical protein